MAVMITTALCLSACGSHEEATDPPSPTQVATPEHAGPDWSTEDSSDEVEDNATDTVKKAMGEYFKKDRSPEEWFAAMEPYLTGDGADRYEYPIMTNIPDGKVTGEPELTRENEAGRTYLINTTAGQFSIEMSQDDSSQWLIDKINAPDGA